MIKGFRDFIAQGNVIDLAVAVVIGGAFTAIVNSVVASTITPLVGLFFEADAAGKFGPPTDTELLIQIRDLLEKQNGAPRV